ncbi:YgfZ/GcvT domain-containing protein [Occallatibacter savannae]|uniref:CAF17-like 4Fe-4S cluster assembly/insertion protein YgfZ n=1 Tax=Occallatibacter savannae TaxID=1002691 RepID=UPI000D6948A6|nr:folate-binding protein YgfZ [Occallatibacter savannae]
MTDHLAVSTILTPLAAQLTTGSNKPQLMEFRGFITPQQLDAPALETAALAKGAAAHDLGWMRRVTVRGEDSTRWLSGMVTNTVKDIPENGGAWNLVLNAQGRIQGDLTVWRDGDSLELEIAADQYDKLMAHFDHFIIMDDVELVGHDVSAETVLGLTGPKATEVLSRMGLPAPSEPMTTLRSEWNGFDLTIRRSFGTLAQHFEIHTPIAGLGLLWRALSTAGATPVGAASLDAFRIAEGIPTYGVDIAERDLPQETSQTRALHFDKGCYLGQEIVERIRSRGNVHRHLRQLEIDGPLPASGTELLLDGASVGQITSAAELPLSFGPRRFALAMVRGEAETKNQPLACKDMPTTGRILAQPPEL